MKYIFILLISFKAIALEVIKPEVTNEYLELNIIRVDPGSFETYTLTNSNLIEMTLVCANNRVYDNNKTAIIRYRNYYNLPVYDFKISNNKVCLDMGKFIESTFMGVDEDRPFKIRLNIKNGMVARIEYPAIDPYTDQGEMEDLLPKKRLFHNPDELKTAKKINTKN